MAQLHFSDEICGWFRPGAESIRKVTGRSRWQESFSSGYGLVRSLCASGTVTLSTGRKRGSSSLMRRFVQTILTVNDVIHADANRTAGPARIFLGDGPTDFGRRQPTQAIRFTRKVPPLDWSPLCPAIKVNHPLRFRSYIFQNIRPPSS